MPDSTELTEEEMDELISGLKSGGAEADMQVVRGGATKQPSQVRVVDQEAVPIDDETRRQMEKEESRKGDNLIRTLRGSAADPKVLAVSAEELAEEIFALKFERERLETAGRDIANTAGRRVTAIKALIDTNLKLKELSLAESIDFNSPQIKILIQLIFSKVKDSLEQAGYSKQDTQTFFQVLQENMKGFEQEAQRMIDQELRK